MWSKISSDENNAFSKTFSIFIFIFIFMTFNFYDIYMLLTNYYYFSKVVF